MVTKRGSAGLLKQNTPQEISSKEWEFKNEILKDKEYILINNFILYIENFKIFKILNKKWCQIII